MWIMMLVLVTLSTGEEETWTDLVQYETEEECYASFDREPVTYDGYTISVRCVKLGMGG